MNFDIHRTFYSMCQTLFYVIIFRHQQLFGHNTELVDLIKSWKLNDIVSCKLNPLRYCLPTIRKKFARVAYVNQVIRVTLLFTRKSYLIIKFILLKGNLLLFNNRCKQSSFITNNF